MPVRLKASLKVQRTRLQYAAWLGNTTSLIIVVDNDIYLKQSPSDEDDIRITTTGQPDLIYNGVPDWLYQGNNLVVYISDLTVFITGACLPRRVSIFDLPQYLLGKHAFL